MLPRSISRPRRRPGTRAPCTRGQTAGPAVSSATIRRLAGLRYELRRFLRFSERAARAAGLTVQQHQLLLGAAGYTDRGWATISELSEFLQQRHNAVVGLVQRAERAGWVRKVAHEDDRRVVRVIPTRRGLSVLQRLSRLHLDALGRIRIPIVTAAALHPVGHPQARRAR